MIEIEPGETCVIPRGIIFRVELVDGSVRACVCENYGDGFILPDRGPIGANCLANPIVGRPFPGPRRHCALYASSRTAFSRSGPWFCMADSTSPSGIDTGKPPSLLKGSTCYRTNGRVKFALESEFHQLVIPAPL